MNYSFSKSHNDFVVETEWAGELTGEILSDGVVSHNNWAITHTIQLPLVLLFDFTNATLDKVSGNDLQSIASFFSGMEDMFPGVHWICIMPKDVQYSVVKMWIDITEKIFNHSHVVHNRQHAEKIIKEIIDSYSEA